MRGSPANKLAILAAMLALSGTGPVLAQEEGEAATAEESPPAAEPAAPGAETAAAEEQKKRSSNRITRGKRIREKEAEGTKAPNRLSQDPVIKSRYRLNGEYLEVDPD